MAAHRCEKCEQNKNETIFVRHCLLAFDEWKVIKLEINWIIAYEMNFALKINSIFIERASRVLSNVWRRQRNIQRFPFFGLKILLPFRHAANRIIQTTDGKIRVDRRVKENTEFRISKKIIFFNFQTKRGKMCRVCLIEFNQCIQWAWERRVFDRLRRVNSDDLWKYSHCPRWHLNSIKHNLIKLLSKFTSIFATESRLFDTQKGVKKNHRNIRAFFRFP